MAESKPLKQQFTDDDLIQCGICHVDIEHPRSLACLHTYCLACLREWSKKGSRKDEIICPLCREATPLPSNGVDGLRSNFLITKLKERKAVLSQLMDKDVKIVCTACDVSDCNEAVTRCLECDDFLCSPCTKAHKIVRLTKNHSILSLVELQSGEVSLVKKDKDEHCMTHTGQVLWFYCKTCEVPICRDCTVVEHPSGRHKLVNLEKAMTGQREEIQKLVKRCQSVKKDVNKAFKKVHQMRQDLQASHVEIDTAIDSQHVLAEAAMIRMLREEAEYLKKGVAKKISTREKMADMHEDELQLLNSRVSTALEMGNKLSADGSDCDVASAYRPLITTLKQLEKVAVPSLQWDNIKFFPVALPMATSSIGALKKMTTTRSNQFGKLDKSMWNLQWKVVATFGEGKLQAPKGVAINGDGNVAVADQNASQVYVFNSDDGTEELVIDTRQRSAFHKASAPHGLAVHQGQYIVADAAIGANINVFNRYGKHTKQIKISGKTSISFHGIAFNSVGRAFLGYSCPYVGVYNFGGDKFESFLDIQSSAKYIAVSSDDNRVVFTHEQAGCRVVDSKGKLIHELCLSSYHSAWKPTGVCTIGEGHDEEVFVCCGGSFSGVYRFSITSGKYLGCVTNNVRNPEGIAFTDDGKLVVAEESCIKVFKPKEKKR